MACITGKESKFTEAQQKEIVERWNDAYDRGGADALGIIIEAAKTLAEDQPDLKAYCGFTVHVVEGVRQRLAEVVNEQVHDVIPQESLIV